MATKRRDALALAREGKNDVKGMAGARNRASSNSADVDAATGGTLPPAREGQEGIAPLPEVRSETEHVQMSLSKNVVGPVNEGQQSANETTETEPAGGDSPGSVESEGSYTSQPASDNTSGQFGGPSKEDEASIQIAEAGSSRSQHRPTVVADATMNGEAQEVPLDAIHITGLNPRIVDPDGMDVLELAESISKVGLIQPIVVCERNGELILVAGEHRYWAAKRLGWTSILAMVRPFTGEADLLAIMGSENEHRKELTPAERAYIYERLASQGQSQKEIAQKYGFSEGTVSVFIKAYRMPAMRTAMQNSELSLEPSVIAELNKLHNDKHEELWPNAIEAALEFLRKRRRTVRELRGWIAEQKQVHRGGQEREVAKARPKAKSFITKASRTLESLRTEEMSNVTLEEMVLYSQILQRELAKVHAIIEGRDNEQE